MDARVPQRMQLSATRVDSDRLSRYPPSSSLRFSGRLKERQGQRLQLVVSADWLPVRNGRKAHGKLLSFEVSSSCKNFPASTLESGSFHNPFDEDLILKSKSQEIGPHLDGRSVYLVGMMGSGKTTVGKILSQALSYSFIDCDKLIEQDVNGTSVAEIFNLYGENFFRLKETEVLQRLSVMHQRVVSTGGGAVVRPINWKYMHKGISVWLDVPLEALAQRIASVGTDSRPLLHHESGDAYSQAFRRLTTLFEERGEAYANANARVSLENIATKRGYRDVCDITPTIIAIEALEQIEDFLGKGGVIA